MEVHADLDSKEVVVLIEDLLTTVEEKIQTRAKAAEEVVEKTLIPAAEAEAEVLVHLLMMTALLLTASLSVMRSFR